MNSLWIYEQSPNKKYRYVLGEFKTSVLICIGVNPSTASPEELDETMKRVQSRAFNSGYCGYIMLNLSPERATNPNDMSGTCDKNAFEKNISAISDILQKYEGGTIWAAWGNSIDEREYLRDVLKEIVNIADKYNYKWVRCGEETKKGHPRHPLYLANKTDFQTFDIHNYINKHEQETVHGK